jgi:hypothetical protein
MIITFVIPSDSIQHQIFEKFNGLLPSFGHYDNWLAMILLGSEYKPI